MARCFQLNRLLRPMLIGIVIFCLLIFILLHLHLNLEGINGCMQCITKGEEDPWIDQRYNSQVPTLLSSRNSNLSTNTSKWWQGLQPGYSELNYSAVVKNLFTMFPDKEHYSDAGPCRCRLCALVGNSGNLEGSYYGPLIDAHDFIIRMNASPTKGYEKDVGSKTTHRAIYPESAIDMDNYTHLVLVPFKVLDLQWLISIFTTKNITKTYRPIKSTIQANMGKVMILHPEFITYVYKSWLQKQGKYPSTGFLMLVFSLHVCDQVNVFGFGARKDGRWDHYFDQKYAVLYNTPEHNGRFEYNIILKLHQKKKIHLYTGRGSTPV